MPVYPKPIKKYGQNFLKDRNIAEKITGFLNTNEDSTIIEIGPGTGSLTEYLVKKTRKNLVLCEIDGRLCQELLQKYGTQAEVRCQNFLDYEFDPQLQDGKVIGNIPYNITSPIIFKILENSSKISQAIIMMQKEVGERLASGPGTKAYGILSVLTQVQCSVKKLIQVGRQSFFPVPEVDSIIVELKPHGNTTEIENFELFKNIVKKTFNQRRKMLQNTLKQVIPGDLVKRVKSVNLSARPENLGVDDFLRLAREIAILMKEK